MFQRRRQTVSLAGQMSPPMPWPPLPPPGESEEEKAKRHHTERDAKKKSMAIERQLEREREENHRRKSYTKILILGQAESGKSTLLKQFQLFYAPQAFKVEAEAWRAVIHLNLVRSVNYVLDILSSNATQLREIPSSSPLSTRPGASWITSGAGPGAGGAGAGGGPSVRELRMRLSPLRQVEVIFVKRLAVDGLSVSVQSSAASTASSQRPPSRVSESSGESGSSGGNSPWYPGRASEVVVRGGSGWKELVRRGKHMMSRDWQKDDMDDARQILHACRDDIAALWASREVQEGLKHEGVTLRNQSGFFLDDVIRVAANDYEPAFRDILRARLQTVGVEEHTIVIEEGDHPFPAEVGQTWLFYDVGGSRHQRAAWAPFFDDVNAIMFLCAMSGFNEFLLEDRTMNRLLDSFTLWKSVCSSQILANVTFILLLNKSDILQAKLEAGQSFNKWVRSYKDAPNDVAHVTEYLKAKFAAIHKSSSPKRRSLHVHVTCAIDMERMTHVIVRVREVILEANLVESTLL